MHLTLLGALRYNFGMENVILIGMPASGKSTAGVLIAKKLGDGFLVTDLRRKKSEGKGVVGLS